MATQGDPLERLRAFRDRVETGRAQKPGPDLTKLREFRDRVAAGREQEPSALEQIDTTISPDLARDVIPEPEPITSTGIQAVEAGQRLGEVARLPTPTVGPPEEVEAVRGPLARLRREVPVPTEEAPDVLRVPEISEDFGISPEIRGERPTEARERRIEGVREERREEVRQQRAETALRTPGLLTAGEAAVRLGQFGRGVERTPLLGLPTTGLSKTAEAFFNRTGRRTPEEAIDALPKSGVQTLTEFLGVGAEIFLTGKALGAVGSRLATAPGRLGRTGRTLELFEPTRRVTTGQALVTEAAVGLPSDVAGAIRERDPFRVPVGVVLGSTLGTALRPKIRGVEAVKVKTPSFEFSATGETVGGFRTPQAATRAGTEARTLQDVTVEGAELRPQPTVPEVVVADEVIERVRARVAGEAEATPPARARTEIEGKGPEIKTRDPETEGLEPLADEVLDTSVPQSAVRNDVQGFVRGEDFVGTHELPEGNPARFDDVMEARQRDEVRRDVPPPVEARLQTLSDEELSQFWRDNNFRLSKENNATAGRQSDVAQSRRLSAKASVESAEREMTARGVAAPNEASIQQSLGVRDVQPANREFVAGGGRALQETQPEDLARIQRDAEEILFDDPFDLTMSERWTMVEGELKRRGVQSQRTTETLSMQPGIESPPTSPLQDGFNPLDAELQFLRNRREVVQGEAASVPSRQNMIQALSSVIGMEPGIGKANQLKKALGFFRVVPEDIRIRNAADVEVYTHEVGHFLHKLWFGGTEAKPRRGGPKGILPKQKQIKLNEKPLERFADELNPLSEGVSGGGLTEGWAEFWRLFFTNPDAAERLAPRTVRYVEKRLESEHDLRNVVISLREDHRLWSEGSASARHRAQTSYERLPAQFNVANEIQTLRQSVIDELQPWQRLQDTLLGENPEDIKDAASDLSRLLRGAQGTAEHFLEHGTLDANTLNVKGEGLDAILARLYFDEPTGRSFKSREVQTEKMRGFVDYWESRRDIEQKLKGLKTGFRTEDSLRILAENHPEIAPEVWQSLLMAAKQGDSPVALEAYRAALRSTPDGGGVNREVFDSIQGYREDLLEYGRDLGLFKQSEIDALLQSNTEYAPFYREFGREGGRGGGKQGQLGKVVKRFKGSERQVINPLESLISDTYKFTAAAHKQEISNALIRLSRQEGAGRFLSEVTPPSVGQKASKDEVLDWITKNVKDFAGEEGDFDAEVIDDLFDTLGDALPDYMMTWRPGDFFGKDNIVSFINPDTGKRQWFEVLDKELFDSLMGMDRQEIGWLTKLASKFSGALRAGSTLAVEFAARNPIRDNLAAVVQSEFGFTPGVDLARGLFELTGRTDLYWKWKAAGGEFGSLVDLDRAGLKKGLEQMAHAGGVDNVLTSPMQALAAFENMVLGPLRTFSAASENSTRLGEFRNAVEGLETQGFKGRELYQRAALASREISVDFARHGTKTQAMRLTAAFWNARIQGYDRLFRAFKKNPQQASTKAIAWITMPTVLNFLANKDDPEYWQLPRWQRDFFWVVKMGDQWFRIPKPFELGIAFGTMPERVMEWMALNDPGSLNSLLGVPAPRVNPKGFAAGSAPLFDVSDFGEQLSRNPLAADVASALLPIPTVVQPLVENYFNYSMFLDRPIVPRALQGRSPFLQTTDRTTDIAKGIGRMVNVAPAKIDNLLFGYTGGLGRSFGELVTGGREVASRLAPGVVPAPEIPRDQVTDLPGIRELTRAFTIETPGATSLSLEQFYSEFQKASEAQQNEKVLIERGDREALRIYRQQNRELLRSWKRLSRTNERIKPLRDRIRATRTERPDTPDGRAARDAKIEDLGRRMTNEAMKGLRSDAPRLPRQ